MGQERKKAAAAKQTEAKKQKTAARKTARDLKRQQQAGKEAQIRLALEAAAQEAREAEALQRAQAAEALRKAAQKEEDLDDAASSSSGTEFFDCLPPEDSAHEPAVVFTAVKASQQPELDEGEDFHSYTSDSDQSPLVDEEDFHSYTSDSDQSSLIDEEDFHSRTSEGEQSPLVNEAQHDVRVRVDTPQTVVAVDKSQTVSVEASLPSTKAPHYPEGWYPAKISHIDGAVGTSTARDADTSKKSRFFLVRWFFEAWAWLQSLLPLSKSVVAKQRPGSKVSQPLLEKDAVDVKRPVAVTTSFDLYEALNSIAVGNVAADPAKKPEGSLFPS